MNLACILTNVMKPEKWFIMERSYIIQFGVALLKTESTFPDKYSFVFLQVKDPVLFSPLTTDIKRFKVGRKLQLFGRHVESVSQ